MVIFAFFKTMFGVSEMAMLLLPQGDPPAFLLDVAPLISQIATAAQGLGAWIPWVAAGSTAAAVFGVWLVLSIVSGVRWLVGWIPTMGGA